MVLLKNKKYKELFFIEIYALKCNSISKIIFEKLFNCISKERKDKIHRLRNNDDKTRSLLSEVLIRNILCKKLGIINSKIYFEKNKYGKPYLRGHEKFHFNISHSEEQIVCAIDHEPIGIDIEKIQQIEYAQLAKQVYTKEECKFIFEDNEEEQKNKFYRLWTLKESYIKLYGKGLSIPLNSFTININNSENIKIFTENNFQKCYFKEFDVDSEYKMSVCSLNNNFAKKVNIIDKKYVEEEIFKTLVG